MDYSIEDLLQAQNAISSSIRKIEKVKETLSKKQPVPKSQHTLATKNLAALKLSLFLIEREMEKFKHDS